MTQDRPYLEATIAGFAEIIVSEDHLEHVRLEAGNPDMTLREAAVWMTDYLTSPTVQRRRWLYAARNSR